MKRIAIIGLGLIGGSLGLALKESNLQAELTGCARTPETGAKALALGAIDRIGKDLISTVDGADLVILATPVLAMKEILQHLGKHLPASCTVTDAASTKVKVMEWASEYLPATVNFVGGHPMAGKESSGIDVAEADLFKNCTYCLVPGENTSPEAVDEVTALAKHVGARPFLTTASEHDNFVAGISHLPFIVSSALVSATTRSSSWAQMSRLAATGYRDVTRLASQSPEMNRDICLSNQTNILRWIDDFSAELDRFRQLIAKNHQSLGEAFLQVQAARQQWLKEREHDKKD